jgi:hypothetical protein
MRSGPAPSGLIGPNGAGKTTAFNAITGVHRRQVLTALRGLRACGWPPGVMHLQKTNLPRPASERHDRPARAASPVDVLFRPRQVRPATPLAHEAEGISTSTGGPGAVASVLPGEQRLLDWPSPSPPASSSSATRRRA